MRLFLIAAGIGRATVYLNGAPQDGDTSQATVQGSSARERTEGAVNGVTGREILTSHEGISMILRPWLATRWHGRRATRLPWNRTCPGLDDCLGSGIRMPRSYQRCWLISLRPDGGRLIESRRPGSGIFLGIAGMEKKSSNNEVEGHCEWCDGNLEKRLRAA